MLESSAPRVQVIVVAYRSAATLQRCVDALSAQTYGDFEAVLWDNGSPDGEVASVSCDARFRKVVQPDNLGFAAANNRAAELSTSEYIALLNPDAFPEPDWLAHMIAAADAHGAASIASLQLDDQDPGVLDGVGDCMSIAGFPWRGGFGDRRSRAPEGICEVFSACGAAALYRRALFAALGGFEERFFCYCEDVDLGFRIRRAGERCLLEPRAVVRHVGGASSGGEGSEFAEFHGTRNRWWCLVRNIPPVLMIVALPAHLLVLAYVLLRSPGLLTVRIKALGEALKGPREAWSTRPPPVRSLSALALALSWSPLALSRRSVVRRFTA